MRYVPTSRTEANKYTHPIDAYRFDRIHSHWQHTACAHTCHLIRYGNSFRAAKASGQHCMKISREGSVQYKPGNWWLCSPNKTFFGTLYASPLLYSAVAAASFVDAFHWIEWNFYLPPFGRSLFFQPAAKQPLNSCSGVRIFLNTNTTKYAFTHRQPHQTVDRAAGTYFDLNISGLCVRVCVASDGRRRRRSIQCGYTKSTLAHPANSCHVLLRASQLDLRSKFNVAIALPKNQVNIWHNVADNRWNQMSLDCHFRYDLGSLIFLAIEDCSIFFFRLDANR